MTWPTRPGSIEESFAPIFLRPFPQTLTGGLQSLYDRSHYYPDRDAGSKKKKRHRNTVFFENVFVSSREGPRTLSCLDLRFQSREVLVFFFYPSLYGFSFGGRGVLIFDEHLVILVSCSFKAFFSRLMASTRPLVQRSRRLKHERRRES